MVMRAMVAARQHATVSLLYRLAGVKHACVTVGVNYGHPMLRQAARAGRRAASLTCATLIAASCGGGSDAVSEESVARAPALSIAAASDLRYVLDDLIALHRSAHPDIGVAASFGSSGSLYAQILNGAPFDLFLSADVAYVRELAARGRVLPDSIFTYARGRLVLWLPATSSLDLDSRGLDVLTDASIARIALANPEHAPYGRAAEAALRSAGVYERVEQKLVLGENVSQAFQFVESGAAQAGLVARSLTDHPRAAPGRVYLVPADAHPPIEQAGALVAAGPRPAAARLFAALITSLEGRAVLEAHGFAPAGP
jgi:molybdate transport system substrate-binding protein